MKMHRNLPLDDVDGSTVLGMKSSAQKCTFADGGYSKKLVHLMHLRRLLVDLG